MNSLLGVVCQGCNSWKTEKMTSLALCSHKDDSRDWFHRCNYHHHWIEPWPCPHCSPKWAFMVEAQKNWKCCSSDVFTQPTFLCRWDRLSSSVFSPLRESFVFSWQGYNNQAPHCSGTLITLSHHCQLPFNLSMNHFSCVHCVTQTRDWEEFTHCV